MGGLGSWFLFGFQITMPFVIGTNLFVSNPQPHPHPQPQSHPHPNHRPHPGVGLVILSIFLYGSKPEQLHGWGASLLSTLGMGPRKVGIRMRMSEGEDMD